MNAAENMTLTVEPSGFEIMRIKTVETADDVERLRQIRNECRAFMTGFTDEVTSGMQEVWWSGVSRSSDWLVWLVFVPGWEDAIGYAMLSRRNRNDAHEGGWWVTIALTGSLRGCGLGTLLYRTMASMANGELVLAAIRSDNEASIRAAEKAGYAMRTSGQAGIVLMVGRAS